MNEGSCNVSSCTRSAAELQLAGATKGPGDLATFKFHLIKNFVRNLVTGTRTPLGLGEKGLNGEKLSLAVEIR
jgi:hypothetical protein